MSTYPINSLSRYRFGISGYPTLKYFPAGSLEPEAYEEARELESLVHFINTKTGTQRNPDGSLQATAGRVEALDAGKRILNLFCVLWSRFFLFTRFGIPRKF